MHHPRLRAYPPTVKKHTSTSLPLRCNLAARQMSAKGRSGETRLTSLTLNRKVFLTLIFRVIHGPRVVEIKDNVPKKDYREYHSFMRGIDTEKKPEKSIIYKNHPGEKCQHLRINEKNTGQPADNIQQPKVIRYGITVRISGL